MYVSKLSSHTNGLTISLECIQDKGLRSLMLYGVYHIPPQFTSLIEVVENFLRTWIQIAGIMYLDLSTINAGEE